MQMKIRLGIVNIGPTWETRHLPALRSLADRFEVRAICDSVQHRAQQAAKHLGAAVCDGFQEVARRKDIDALLFLSPGWYGALPIYAACDAGKAIYSTAALVLEDLESTRLRQTVEQAGIAFMAELSCRMAPATLRLKELIATRLGTPRLLFCNRRHLATPQPPKGQTDQGNQIHRDLVELVDWSRYIIASEPSSISATFHQAIPEELFSQHNEPSQQQGKSDRVPPSSQLCGQQPALDYFSAILDFSIAGSVGTGPMAQITCGDYIPKSWRESASFRRPAELEVVCQRGVAFVDLPYTLAWFDEAGQHLETLDHERPVGEQLLLHFHRAVESLVLKTASLEDAHRAISIASKVRKSCETGMRIACNGPF
jgi:predicted dehydrogenase